MQTTVYILEPYYLSKKILIITQTAMQTTVYILEPYYLSKKILFITQAAMQTTVYILEPYNLLPVQKNLIYNPGCLYANHGTPYLQPYNPVKKFL
jgi:hypothetical protein